MTLAATIRKLCFGIAPEEALFTRRGFRPVGGDVQSHLERLGQTFIAGYRCALEFTAPSALSVALGETPGELRGFAYEGAAMALTLLDGVSPIRRDRFTTLLAGPGVCHAYMLHVGVGWALARLPWGRAALARRLTRDDGLLRWLVVDGLGFHEGYFRAPQYVERRELASRLAGYAARAFDQGLGRSLWFSQGADVVRIAAAIARFDIHRQPDLWSGVGLACAYAGGVDGATVSSLPEFAGEFRLHVAQGAAFAAQARRRAGNPAGHTDRACRILTGLSAEEAALVTDECLVGLPPDGDLPAFEYWRQRIRERIDQTISNPSEYGMAGVAAGPSEPHLAPSFTVSRPEAFLSAAPDTARRPR